ncbi:hypothetical protein DP090_010465 [Pseudomonas sp. MDMC216]|jgi:hypothetical protein|nr:MULTISPECIES: hypothetical protein [unclassified Pseudomonas]MBA4682990.1 hypothetical protein [Pseudomonas sp.]MDI5993449.1 hypothetical protein [Pseudomonas sp. MDMC216]MDI6008910.1 hypothetical protein [Pseudomonas sp. MDMC17]
MTKTQPTERISKIRVGETDSTGAKIVSVLATNNEFAIYEIDHPDVNSKLKVLIDGHTDESERKIQERFNSVKQKYIEAKGLLSRAANYGMMKQRIAHTLATCLNSETVSGEKEFSVLISTIRSDHENLVINRCLYLIPCLFSVMLFFIISLWLSVIRDATPPQWWIIGWQVFTSLLAAALGCGLSMLITARSLNFEEFTSKNHYLILGLERLLLSCMAGAVAYIAIKSEIAFPTFAKANHWSFMAILVLSGFSESFIPSILGKMQADKT